MLDSLIHKITDKPLNMMGKVVCSVGVSANSVTLIGFFFGVVSILCIGTDHLQYGFIFFLLNRLCDGLDGSVARLQGKTDRGEFLDIFSDFIVYAGMVFAFVLSHPEDAIWGIFLIFSFTGAAGSSLSYMLIASKAEENKSASPKLKPIGYGGNIEAVIALSLMCLFPEIFEFIALGCGVLCWVTTGERIVRAWIDFKHPRTERTGL